MEFKNNLIIVLVVLFCLNHVHAKRKSTDRCMSTLVFLRRKIEHCQGMFLCDGGDYCIESRLVCDGFQQCADGTDEAYCPFKPKKCDDYHFKCPGENKCCRICNGVPECSTGIDEQNCAPVCKKGEVICGDGNCATVGDGKDECSDKSDERCPAIPAPLVCDAGHIPCKRESTGPMECVPLCDGQIDCAGGQDERPVVQCELTCPSFHVKCVVDDDGNKGCAPVCTGTPRQCKEIDETVLDTNKCDDIRNLGKKCAGFDISCLYENFFGDICCGCIDAAGNPIVVVCYVI